MTIQTRNGPLDSVHVIEWTPDKFWVVRVTNRDGSYTPLYHCPRTFSQAQARAWLRERLAIHGGVS